MADEIKKVLTIQTSEGERSVKSLRKEISDYRDALLNVEKDSKDWEDITKKLVKAQEDLTSVTKVNKQTVDAAKDSIVGMEREYKALYDTYKLLSEEQRKTKFGKEMASQLDALSEKLNDTKKEVGNYKDNIGRYTQGVLDAFTKMGDSAKALQNPMKLASNGLKTVGKSMTAIATNPVGAVLLALITIFKQVSSAIKGNEEAQMKLNEAMAAFEPIGNLIKNIFNAIGEAVVWVADKVGGLIALFSKSAAATRELAQATNKLTKTKREYDKLNAKDEARIAQLREEANTTDDLNKKQKLLNDAKELQAKVNERNIEIATEENRILTEKSKLTANSTADNEALTQSEINLGKATADSAKKMKELDSELKSSKNNTDKVKDAANDAAAKIKKMKDEVAAMSETIRKSHLNETQKLQEEKQAWIEKYKAIGKATEEVEKYYDAQIEGVRKSQRKEEGKTYTDVLKAEGANSDMYKRLGISGTQSLDILNGYLEQLETAATDNLKNNYQRIFQANLEGLFEEMFENARNKVADDLRDNYSWTFEELVRLSKEDIEALEENVNNLVSALADRVVTMDGESVEDAYIRVINEKKAALTNLINETVPKGLPILEETQDKLKSLESELELFVASYYDLIGLSETGGDFWTFLRESAEKGGHKGLANLVTNGLFGTGEGHQDINGFAMFDKFDDGIKKLHKGLYNSSKVWQDYGQAVTTILDAVAGKWQHNIEKQLESGEISEDEAKKQFKQMKAMQYALAGINMASGIVQAFADPSLVTWYAKAAAAAAVAATGVAQMITISQTEMGSGNGSTNSASVATTPALIDSTPYSYTRTLQTAEEEEMLNQPQYVSVTDINSVQNKVNVREEQSSF